MFKKSVNIYDNLGVILIWADNIDCHDSFFVLSVADFL